MSRFTNWMSRLTTRDNAPVVGQPTGWLTNLLQSLDSFSRTASGESVTFESASRMLDVYAAVRVRAEAFGSTPVKVYEITGRGKTEAINHDLYYLLGVEPNPEMAADVFWQTIQACKALTGNGYAQIVRNDAGRPAALYPIHPRRTRPVRLPNNGLAYETSDGERPGQVRIVAASDMLHFRSWSLDGLLGLSPIEHAMQSLGIALASEKFGGRFFANGGRPNGVLSTNTTLNPQQQAEMRSTWQGQTGGENQGKTAVLWGDWKYTAVGITPEEAQFLDTRKYARTQIAALIGVPPHKIGDTTRLSNSNHEQEELQFVTDTLRPEINNTQLEVARKLFPQIGRNSGKYVMLFDLRERLRADFKTTHEALALGRQWGWYTANDCRYELDENPLGPEGDVLWYPVNMGNAKALLDPAALVPSGSSKPALPEPKPTGEPADERNALPAEVIAPPTPEERMALAQCGSAFVRIFADATGRISAREQRDTAAVATAFEPALRSILDQVEAQAQARFNLRDGWHGDAGEKIVTDHLKTIAQRAKSWTPETAAHNAGIELNKAIRAIALHTYRDAGAAVALEGVEHAA